MNCRMFGGYNYMYNACIFMYIQSLWNIDECMLTIYHILSLLCENKWHSFENNMLSACKKIIVKLLSM